MYRAGKAYYREGYFIHKSQYIIIFKEAYFVHVNRIVTSGKGKLLRLLFNTITRIVLILPRTKLITQLFLATIYT